MYLFNTFLSIYLITCSTPCMVNIIGYPIILILSSFASYSSSPSCYFLFYRPDTSRPAVSMLLQYSQLFAPTSLDHYGLQISQHVSTYYISSTYPLLLHITLINLHFLFYPLFPYTGQYCPPYAYIYRLCTLQKNLP